MTRSLFALSLVACGASHSSLVAVRPAASQKAIASQASVDPGPEHDWHTWDPEPIDGGPFYRVVATQLTAPSVYSAPCRPVAVEGGAVFVTCSGLARVDGNRLDLSIPSPSGGLTRLQGKYPNDLWATVYTADFSDGWRPPLDVFIEGEYELAHFDGARWTRIPSTDDRHPYVGGSSAVLMVPPAKDPEILTNKPACIDHSCLRALPHVVTTGSVKPDFSSLSGTIVWTHIHDTKEGGRDFSFAVDPAGPVYVAMRALDPRTKKKGFGVAKWTQATGATFTWLPVDAKDGRPGEFIAKDGKAKLLFVRLQETVLLEHDGATWSKKPFKGTSFTPYVEAPPPAPLLGRFFLGDDGFMEKTTTGGDRVALPRFPGPGDELVMFPPDDVWAIRRDGLFRTKRPPETLYRFESSGELHPWAPYADEKCPHLFAVLDASDKASVDRVRKQAWHFDSKLPLVELEVHGLVVVGMVVPTLAKGEAILEANRPLFGREMEGTPHEIVCARPVSNAKPFVEVPVPRE